MLIMKDGRVQPARLKITSSPSYTVAEIETLMREWLNESDNIGGTEELALAFRLSIFIEWLKKREEPK